MSLNPIADYLGYAGDGGFSETDRRHSRHIVDHGTFSKKVSQRLCEEIRRRRHNGQSAETVHESLPIDLSRCAMDAHAAGRCPHPTDVPPVNAEGQLSQVQCVLLRMACWDGMTQREAAALPADPVDQTTVWHHVTGQCSHLCGVPPIEQVEVSAGQCQYWCERRDAGDSVETIADDTAFAARTVSKHTLGDCSHGGEG